MAMSSSAPHGSLATPSEIMIPDAGEGPGAGPGAGSGEKSGEGSHEEADEDGHTPATTQPESYDDLIARIRRECDFEERNLIGNIADLSE